MSTSQAPGGRGILPFFALAFAITWALDVPWALACIRHETPPPYAMALTGLGAFGPTLAALLVAAPRRELREVFGRWRMGPGWPLLILLALGLQFPLHIIANLIEVALGGHPAHWFYPPIEPERITAAIVFPLGEEFGWRGFAYPRLADRYGPVLGSILLGQGWALWHLGMMFQPDKSPTLAAVAIMMVTLGAGSVLWAWFLERGNRSMAIAIALHIGAHLDNDMRAPEGEVRLRALRVLVLVIAAALAARSLRADRRAVAPT
ncbi:MAG: CPBP family intramembrane glutamic endopeptidase [Byssovorax sp.]